MVSSAWLAREFQVDARTVAAALRPYGVRPAGVERGVRGYVTAELAGIVLEAESAAPNAAGLSAADDGMSAVDRLSAALGHPAGPVLRAAGMTQGIP
jgi:hypothetical protein